MLARMSAPLDFLRIFAGQLRQAGIQFAITSGMACPLWTSAKHKGLGLDYSGG
jgi:hypothetical protein